MAAAKKIDRLTVDLSTYPNLVVIHLGMRVQSLRGLSRVLRLGRQIRKAVAEAPDGLLLQARRPRRRPRCSRVTSPERSDVRMDAPYSSGSVVNRSG
jgi:hypothetical protein